MPSQTKTTRLPADLAEAAALRAQVLGYATWTDFIKGLMRYDMLVQGGHDVTLPWSKLSLDEQDKIDRRLLDVTRKGKGERGQLLRRILQEVGTGKAVGAVLQEVTAVGYDWKQRDNLATRSMRLIRRSDIPV